MQPHTHRTWWTAARLVAVCSICHSESSQGGGYGEGVGEGGEGRRRRVTLEGCDPGVK